MKLNPLVIAGSVCATCALISFNQTKPGNCMHCSGETDHARFTVCSTCTQTHNVCAHCTGPLQSDQRPNPDDKHLHSVVLPPGATIPTFKSELRNWIADGGKAEDTVEIINESGTRLTVRCTMPTAAALRGFASLNGGSIIPKLQRT